MLSAAQWAPLTWVRWVFGPQQVRGAAVVCEAGHAMSIGGGQPFGSVHAIDVDGRVSPSVVCPYCAWHVCASLVGWPASESGVILC